MLFLIKKSSLEEGNEGEGVDTSRITQTPKTEPTPSPLNKNGIEIRS